MPEQDDLVEGIAEFVDRFWLVFENDWEFTRFMISSGGYIASEGSFLNPKIGDIENNWANRARLLESYPRLQEVMQRHRIISPFLPED